MVNAFPLAGQFLEEIRKASSVLVGSHLNPDGDALGSALAVSHYLDGLGVSNEVLSNNQTPKNLEFLPGVDRVRSEPLRTDHDLAIVLDLDSLDRLGSVRPFFEACPRMVVIDHHVPHAAPGDLRIVDVEAPATSLILARLLIALEAPLTPEIATCLLTGIFTDTGSFRFRNTTPESLSLSAILLEKGADINMVSEEIYGRIPLSAQRLYGRVLQRMKLTKNNRVCWSTLRLTDFTETGAADEDTEGFANDLLCGATVEIAAFFRETKPDCIRTSIRSRRDFDVSAVAREFGGGGHRNAAGCTIHGPLDQAAASVVERLESCLESS
jgi:phosphoesterase RecJ-like protein